MFRFGRNGVGVPEFKMERLPLHAGPGTAATQFLEEQLYRRPARRRTYPDSAPATTKRRGHLRIERFLHEPRPHPPSYLSWIDIRSEHPAAGRYLITVDDNDTFVVPASAAVIADELYRRAELGHL